jgi:hypothetical protein
MRGGDSVARRIGRTGAMMFGTGEIVEARRKEGSKAAM